MHSKNITTRTRETLIAVVLFVLLLSIFFILSKVLTKTDTKGLTETLENKNDLMVFESARVPLSFEYPLGFPVKALGSEYDHTYLGDENVEMISFTNEQKAIPNATSDSYGYLSVVNVLIDDLYSYIEKPLINDPSVDAINIEDTYLGSNKGYRLNVKRNTKYGGFLGPIAEWTYYYYDPETKLLYQTALTNPNYLDSDPEKITRIYEEIILPSINIDIK